MYVFDCKCLSFLFGGITFYRTRHVIRAIEKANKRDKKEGEREPADLDREEKKPQYEDEPLPSFRTCVCFVICVRCRFLFSVLVFCSVFLFWGEGSPENKTRMYVWRICVKDVGLKSDDLCNIETSGGSKDTYSLQKVLALHIINMLQARLSVCFVFCAVSTFGCLW